MAAVAAIFVSVSAMAANSSSSCTGYGKFEARRAVTGEILNRHQDRLGFSHIVVKDAQSGCRVFVLTPNRGACAAGKRFEGFGRLRSDFKGADYDATLDQSRDRGKCFGDAS